MQSGEYGLPPKNELGPDALEQGIRYHIVEIAMSGQLLIGVAENGLLVTSIADLLLRLPDYYRPYILSHNKLPGLNTEVTFIIEDTRQAKGLTNQVVITLTSSNAVDYQWLVINRNDPQYRR